VFKLTIEDDEGKTTVVPIIRDEMTIGRDEGNTIRLTERNVSRRHARLMRQNGSIYVEDLKSFTGIRLNGAKIAALTAVNDGDQLQIGDYKIRVKSDRPADAVATDHRATRPAVAAVAVESVIPHEDTAPYTAMPPIRTPAPVPRVRTPPPGSIQVPAIVPAPIPGATPVVPTRAPTPQPSTAVTSMGRAVTPRPISASTVANLMPTPDPLEAQPTIPLRMLSDVESAKGTGVATPARLVVLSTELAGKEFQIDRASLVIGRTNENDVVLNHRSISRHHAKIVQDRDHYTIVDLQSANGVRVNGEDYERIELHAGDVVELGHVRIRFVGPAEHYVFNPLARSERGRSRVPMALMGVVVAVGVGVAVQRMLAPRDDDRSATSAARAPAAPATPAAIAASVPVAAPGAGDVLALAGTQAQAESWDAALGTLDRLSAMLAAAPATDPEGALKKQAGELRQHVERERRSAIVFAKFDEAAREQNGPAAVDWYGELPADSIYKARARSRYDQARIDLLSRYLATAEKLRAAGKCADLRQEIELVDKLDPENSAAAEKLRNCHPHVGAGLAAMGPRPARPSAPAAVARLDSAGPGTRHQPASTAESAPAPAAGRRVASADGAPLAAKAVAAAATAEVSDVDADALMKQARDAWLRQQCGSAIDLSRRAIRARPGMVDAYQVIAACSCSLKDADGATRAYAKLDEKSRTLVRNLCQRNGIAVSAE